MEYFTIRHNWPNWVYRISGVRLVSRGTTTIVQLQPASACLGWAGLGWLIQFPCPQCEQRGGGGAAAAPLDTRFYRPRVQGLQPRGGKPTSGDQWQCEHQWPESGAVSQLDCDHQLRGPARGSNPQPGATEPPANTSIIGGGHGSQQYTYIDAGWSSHFSSFPFHLLIWA